MKRPFLLRLVVPLTTTCGILAAQTPSSGSLQQVKDEIAEQSRQIADQQREIDALHAALEGQKRLLQQAMSGTPAPPAPQPSPPKPPTTAQKAVPVSGAPQAANEPLPLNASQEVRFSPVSPTLKLGPADVRLQGYIALTGLYDSANTGGSIGTNFAGIPYSNTPEGNATEFRLSSQRTRVAVRVDTKLAEAPLAAYLEGDFRGTTSRTVAVTSSSFGFRVRQAWIDYNPGKYQFSVGQMFSLMTPVRFEVTPNPVEAMMTYAVDAQYLAGLIWDRAPALRFAYRPNPSSTLAVSLENPEQQVGTVVKFPVRLASTLSAQYNTGTAELKTPNLAPDTIFKYSFNAGSPGRRFHLDTAALFRFFRNYDPADISRHKDALGIGGNLHLGLDLTPKLHLVLTGFLSSGGGRYIGGLSPDVVVRTDGEISPVKAHSWIGGLEFAATKRTMLFGYYNGVYTSRNTFIDTDLSHGGFGYAGSNAARRSISEWTAGWAQLFWNGGPAGSIQLNTQYSYIRNNPWSQATGPRFSTANLILGQIRYNLP